MNIQLLRTVAGLVALALIAGFILMYGYIIWGCWRATDCTKLDVSDQFVYVATGLAGLVGGVVAMMFNEKLPVTAKSAGSIQANHGQVVSESGTDATLQAAAAVLTPNSADALQTISVVYVAGYFLVGLAAIVAWILIEPGVIDLIKNLALIAMGLFLAIARSFLSVPSAQT